MSEHGRSNLNNSRKRQRKTNLRDICIARGKSDETFKISLESISAILRLTDKISKEDLKKWRGTIDDFARLIHDRLEISRCEGGSSLTRSEMLTHLESADKRKNDSILSKTKYGMFKTPILCAATNDDEARKYGNIVILFRSNDAHGNEWMTAGMHEKRMENGQVEPDDLWFYNDADGLYYRINDEYMDDGVKRIPGTGDIFYHGTSIGNIDSIKKIGLKAGKNTGEIQ